MPRERDAVLGGLDGRQPVIRPGLDRTLDDPDAPVFVGCAFNKAFSLKGVEPVNDRLVGSNLASELDFSDEGALRHS